MVSLLFVLCALQGTVRQVKAIYIQTPPVIDGRLDKIWYQAKPVVGLTQQEPDEGQPASESTEVYVLYDDANLYVAFHCYQNKVKAWISSWDNAEGDRVGVYLNTFGDRRTAYGFVVNARGVQKDFLVTNDGRSFDDSWDGIWWASARITSEGYIVEIVIPFKSIRYKQGLDRWGINFSRDIIARDETDYWAPMSRTEVFRSLSTDNWSESTLVLRASTSKSIPLGLFVTISIMVSPQKLSPMGVWTWRGARDRKHRSI